MVDIEVIAVGGYNEVGRNMTAVRVGKEIVIFDIGLYLDPITGSNNVDMENMHSLDLIQMGAIPDDTVMNSVEGTVKAIVCTHGHLDHIGAIQKLAHRYNCPIISTPYTNELIKQQIEGERKFSVMNKTFALKAGGKYTISQSLTLEFIRVQHSIIDSVMAVLHTPVGCVVYANDFKFDMTPVIGEAPDLARMLRRVLKEGKDKFLLVATGHQGEPGSMLSRIALNETPLKIEKGDKILFSANIIPTPTNYAQRAEVDRLLIRQGARIFDGLHVTGHAYYQEHYDLLAMLNPEHIIPSHGPFSMKAGHVTLGSEFGYALNKEIHIMQNGDRLVLPK